MFWNNILNFILRRDYVLLTTCRSKNIRRAYKLGKKMYVNPYLPETRIEILPNGAIGDGESYVDSWEPLTSNIEKFYDSRPTPKVKKVYRQEIIEEIVEVKLTKVEINKYEILKKDYKALNNQLQTANNMVKKLRKKQEA